MPTWHASSKQIDDIFSKDLDVADTELRFDIIDSVSHGGKDIMHGSGHDARSVEVRPIDSLVIRTEHRMRLPGSCLSVNQHGSIESYRIKNYSHKLSEIHHHS